MFEGSRLHQLSTMVDSSTRSTWLITRPSTRNALRCACAIIPSVSKWWTRKATSALTAHRILSITKYGTVKARRKPWSCVKDSTEATARREVPIACTSEATTERPSSEDARGVRVGATRWKRPQAMEKKPAYRYDMLERGERGSEVEVVHDRRC